MSGSAARRGALRVERAVAAAVVSLFVLYLGDTLAIKYRDEPMGTVQVVGDYTIQKKYGKVEYVYDEPIALSCVRALFPHYSEKPCWYVRLTAP